MAKDIKIPQIAEGVESATVSEILVSEGDSIEKDQSLITVESDKASVDIPSPESGTVKSIEVSEGDEVKVGDVILSLEASEDEEEEEDTAEEKDKSDEKEKSESDSKEDEEEKKSDKKEDAEDETDEEEKSEDEDDEETESSESEEKEADEEGKSEDEDDANKEGKDEEDEDEEKTESSETKEKETDAEKKSEDEDKETGEDEEDQEDVEDAEDEKEEEKSEDSKDQEKPAKEKKSKKESKAEVAAAPGVRRLARELGIDIDEVKGSEKDGRITKEDVKAYAKRGETQASDKKSLSLPDFSQWGETETKSFSGIRSATAKNTASSWQNIPHVFQFDEADISGIEKYIEKHKEKAEEAGAKLTITSILTKIAAGALREFPKFNASIDVENQEMILKKYVNIGIAVDTEKGLLVPVVRDADQKSIIEISAEITELAEKARAGKLSPEDMQGGNFTISNLGGIGGTNFTPIILHPQVAILGVSRSTKKPVYREGEFEPRDILPLSVSYDHRLIDGAEGVRFLKWIVQALEDPYAALLGV